MRLVSIDQPESENPNEETSFEIEEEDALTQGGFSKWRTMIGQFKKPIRWERQSIWKPLKASLKNRPSCLPRNKMDASFFIFTLVTLLVSISLMIFTISMAAKK